MANIDKSKVERQAREILDKFAHALEKVEKESGKEESYIDRDEFEREEGEGRISEEGFKKRFLENAPNHDNDFVIGERGGWKNG